MDADICHYILCQLWMITVAKKRVELVLFENYVPQEFGWKSNYCQYLALSWGRNHIGLLDYL